MYTFDSRVRYSETDENSRLTVESMIDYLQDCTNFHSEDLGVGIAYHRQQQTMWILTYWQIIIEDYPKMGEHIRVGTQAYGFEKMFGYRNFMMSRQDDPQEPFLLANSIWALMDLKTGRPMIVTDEIGNVYGKHERLPMNYSDTRKIRLPKEGGVTKDALLVKEHHLDTNHHVNNGQYVRMALEAAGLSQPIKELRVEYRKQAVLGDEITPILYPSEDKYLVALTGTDHKPFAITEFYF